MKELYRNLPSITQKASKGQVFLVVKHAKPVFEIRPVGPVLSDSQKKHTLKDLRKIRFRDSDPHLSRHIDDIIAGA